MYGEDGDDELFGGQGPSNVAVGGPGGGIARVGSALGPSDVWLDLQENYQFASISTLNKELVSEVGDGKLAPGELNFSQLLGNFVASRLASGDVMSFAAATTQLIVMP